MVTSLIIGGGFSINLPLSKQLLGRLHALLVVTCRHCWLLTLQLQHQEVVNMEAEKPLLVAGNVTSPDHHVPGGPELQGGGRLLVGGSGGQGRVSRQGLEQSDQLGILHLENVGK